MSCEAPKYSSPNLKAHCTDIKQSLRHNVFHSHGNISFFGLIERSDFTSRNNHQFGFVSETTSFGSQIADHFSEECPLGNQFVQCGASRFSRSFIDPIDQIYDIYVSQTINLVVICTNSAIQGAPHCSILRILPDVFLKIHRQ